MAVGIRELKNRLSYYLRMVKKGKKLAVTDRGQIIAYITPAAKSPQYEKVIELVRKGKGVWKGGKPAGSEPLVRIKGKPVSQIVLEERR